VPPSGPGVSGPRGRSTSRTPGVSAPSGTSQIQRTLASMPSNTATHWRTSGSPVAAGRQHSQGDASPRVLMVISGPMPAAFPMLGTTTRMPTYRLSACGHLFHDMPGGEVYPTQACYRTRCRAGTIMVTAALWPALSPLAVPLVKPTLPTGIGYRPLTWQACGNMRLSARGEGGARQLWERQASAISTHHSARESDTPRRRDARTRPGSGSSPVWRRGDRAECANHRLEALGQVPPVVPDRAARVIHPAHGCVRRQRLSESVPPRVLLPLRPCVRRAPR